MFTFKQRINLLYKLSNEELPSDKVVNIKPNTGSPPLFTASNRYPSLKEAFSANVINIINELSELLNKALFYASDGVLYMEKLCQQSFTTSFTDISETFSRDLKLIALFVKQVYVTLFNQGLNYENPVSRAEYLKKFNSLLKSNNLLNLSKLNPSSQLATKLGVDLRSEIIEILNNKLLPLAPAK